MKRAILITGLCGSGKTTYAKGLGLSVLEYGLVHNYRNGITNCRAITRWLRQHEDAPVVVLDSWGFNLDPRLSLLRSLLGDRCLELRCLYTAPEELAMVQRARHTARGRKHAKSQLTLDELRQTLARETADFADRFVRPMTEAGLRVRWLFRAGARVVEQPAVAHLRRITEADRALHFLLLSDWRTGTQMLWSALAAHPGVRVQRLLRQAPGEDATPAMLHREWERFRVQDLPSTVTHLGVMQHRQGPGWIERHSTVSPARYWQMLCDRHDRVICLRRENLLRQFLSGKVEAIAANRHAVSRPRADTPGPVTLPVAELHRFITSTQQLRASVDSAFPQRLDVTYEQLTRDWPKRIRRVQEYLGVTPQDYRPTTYQQEQRPLRDAIANYAEVATYLAEQQRQAWLEEDA